MRPSVRIRLNQMAKIIREKKAVSFGELCLIMDMAPSTLYNYARMLRNVFLDIKFEGGVFESVWDEKMEQLSRQKTLTKREG